MLSQDQLNEQIAHAQEQIDGWQKKLDELHAQEKTVTLAGAAAAYNAAVQDGRTEDLEKLFNTLADAHHQVLYPANAAGASTGAPA